MSTKKRIIKRGVSSCFRLLLCMTILLSSIAFAPIRSNASVVPTVSVNKLTDVDVLLTVGTTTQNIKDYSTDLKSKLVEKGIPASRINITSEKISSFSSSGGDAKTIFNTWTNYPDSSGQWAFDDTTKSIGSTQNVGWTGYWNSTAEAQKMKDIVINYDFADTFRNKDCACIAPYNTSEYICHPDPQGFTFRMTQDEKTKKYSYYAFWIYTYQQVAGLFKVTDVASPNEAGNGILVGWTGTVNPTVGSTVGNTTCLGFTNLDVNPLKPHHVKIEATGNDIEVYYENSSTPLFDVTDTSRPLLQGSYGPFTFSTPNAKLFNMGVEASTTKTFNKAIREPDWKDGSKRFIVNLDDSNTTGLSDSDTDFPEILTRMDNEDLYYIGWGNNANKEQAIGTSGTSGFIAKNSGKGTFINRDADGRTYDGDIDAMANYIYGIYSTSIKADVEYLTNGSPYTLDVTPSSEKTNTIDADFPNGKWKVVHDPSVYENNDGIASYSGSYLNNLDVSFEKPGKYDIYYANSSTPVKTLYIHRKPIGSFSVAVDGTYKVSITNNSYDPDMMSDSDKGIAASEWQWKEVSSDTWRSGKPTAFTAGKDYLVGLKVQDHQGEWSTAYSKYSTSNTSITTKPVADFLLSPVSFNEDNASNIATINDRSYDPAGKSITNEWTVYKNGVSIYGPSVTPMTDFTGLTAGEYVVSLRVKNSNNTWSETFSSFITINTVTPNFNTQLLTKDSVSAAVYGKVDYTDIIHTSPIVERGIEYRTDSQAVYTRVLDSETGEGDFIAILTGLSPSTTYYVRSFSINSLGTSKYDDAGISFTTDSTGTSKVLPTATGTSLVSKAGTTAKLKAAVSIADGGAIIRRGIQYRKVGESVYSEKADTEAGSGTFTMDVTGLCSNTEYIARGFATSLAGTAYDTVGVSFKTDVIPAPVVMDTSLVSTAGTSAILSAIVSSTVSEDVYKRGIQYMKVGESVYSEIVDTETGNGTFTLNVTGLSPNTEYVARGFANNYSGTAYDSDWLSFNSGELLTSMISVYSSVINEGVANNGSISVTQEVYLKNGTFASDMSNGVTVNNLPSGLGILVKRNSDNKITIAFTGNAISHKVIDSIRNASITINKSKIDGATENVTSGNFAFAFTDSITSVSVSGIAQVGQTLTAAILPKDATVSYQWKAGDSNVGTNLATYVIGLDDLGKTITVTATGTGSYFGTVTSSLTNAVIAAPAIYYTITYDGNGNDSGSVPTDSIFYISGAYLRVIGQGKLAKSGYSFYGWNTTADGSGKSYKVNDTFAVSADVTLYAQWTKIASAQTPKFTASNVRGTETAIQPATAMQLLVTAEVNDGGTLSYQWHKNTKNSTADGTPINGATSSSYTPPTDTLGITYYYVVATNTLTVEGKITTASNISGNREVIVLGSSPVVYNISNTTGSTMNNITLSNEYATQYQNYTTTLNILSGYILPNSITVKMGGLTLVSGVDYIYSKMTGELTVYNVTDKLSITAAGVVIPTLTYTITFNSNGGSAVSAISGAYGTGITLPISTKTGYSFGGWYRDSGFATSYLSTTMGAENIILYAKWDQTKYDINGNIEGEDKNDVYDATVKLMIGSRQIAQVTTDVSGNFSISGVPSGTYNLVISKDDQTITLVVTVAENNILLGTVTLPKGNKNSVIEVKPATPDIIVDKLNDFFYSDKFTQDDRNIVDEGGKVEIKLTAEKKDESGDNAAANADSIINAAGRKELGMFIDLTLSKIVTPNGSSEEKPVKIEELEDVLVIDIPLPEDLQGKTEYVIYRYHGTEVQTITETKNSDGEYFKLNTDGTTLKLYTKKFSTYAIAYTKKSNDDTTTSTNSGETTQTIITGSSEGGNVTVSKDNKIATITPEEGYVIVDVLVDGKSVGATATYTFTDSKSHKISAVFAKKVALPYYMKDDKKVYIGFSSIEGNIYDYIAPNGETVEFEENPKSFTDIENHWAKANIDFVTEREVFQGTENNIFSPEIGMTRAMFVTVVGRLYERSYGSITGNTTFSDMDTGDYYAPYVAWAHENGIIKGVGENQFAPDTEVTREEMASIMFRFATYLGKAPKGAWMINVTYPDKADISDWAMDSAAYSQLKGIITGSDSGNFMPQATATRAEVSTAVERFIKEILK